MAKVAASLGGNYTTHMGSEGHEIGKEVAFAIRVADEAAIPVHIFHVKIRGEELLIGVTKESISILDKLAK